MSIDLTLTSSRDSTITQDADKVKNSDAKDSTKDNLNTDDNKYTEEQLTRCDLNKTRGLQLNT